MASEKKIAEENLFKTFKQPWMSAVAHVLKTRWQILVVGAVVTILSYFAMDRFSFLGSTGETAAKNFQNQIKEAKAGELYSIFWAMLQEDTPEVMQLAAEQLIDEDSAKRDNMTLAFSNAVGNWKGWPKEKGHSQIRLASVYLSRNIEKMPTPQQRMAVQLASTFLLWPRSSINKNNTILLANANRIITGSSYQPNSNRLALQDSTENQPSNSEGFPRSVATAQSGLWAPDRPVRLDNVENLGGTVKARNASVVINRRPGSVSDFKSDKNKSEIKIFDTSGSELSISPVDPTATRNLVGGHISLEMKDRFKNNQGIRSRFANPLPSSTKSIDPDFRSPKRLTEEQDQAGQLDRQDRTNWDQIHDRGESSFRTQPNPGNQIPNRNPIYTPNPINESIRNPETNRENRIPTPKISPENEMERSPTERDLVAKIDLRKVPLLDVMKRLRSPNKQVFTQAATYLRQTGLTNTNLTQARKLVSEDPMTRLQLTQQLEFDSSVIAFLFLKQLAKDKNRQVRASALKVMKGHANQEVQKYARNLEIKEAKLPNLSRTSPSFSF